MEPIDQFTVPQDHGKDSPVTVIAGTTATWRGSERLLRFETRQSLKSQSGRAWNVMEAINAYCQEHGYIITEETQYSVTARYDPQAHSRHAWEQTRQKIQSDPRYTQAIDTAKKHEQSVAHFYGPLISQLKNLARALEAKGDAACTRMTESVRIVQASVLQEIDLPAHLTDYDRDWLDKPMYRSEVRYRHHNGYPTDSMEDIIALLD